MIDIRTKPAPIEVVTPIKPSEAIRLGCLTKPVQTFGTTFDRTTGACVVGAMVVGFGAGRLPEGAWDAIIAAPCPLGCVKRERTWSSEVGPSVAAHLNDDHRWSRERIADWLEGLGL